MNLFKKKARTISGSEVTRRLNESEAEQVKILQDRADAIKKAMQWGKHITARDLENPHPELERAIKRADAMLKNTPQLLKTDKPKRVNKLYTKLDDTTIREMFNVSHTDEEIANLLNRNPDAIAKRRSVLGCVKFKRPKKEAEKTAFDQFEEGLLKKLRPDNLEITRQTLAALGYELTLTKVKK